MIMKCLLVCVAALRLSQLSCNHVGTLSCLPVFNWSTIKGINCFAQGQNTMPMVRLKLVT